MREVAFSLSDVDLFDQDIGPSDYDFFKKHTGAFKRMLEDQSKERKKEFVEKFKTFALTHGCMKGCPSKNDNRHFLDEAIAQYDENFVNGKFSTAKSIVMDAVILAQNRHNLQYMGANSYSKDPFFHKETRDTFRRLFGQPSEKGTCLKVVCILPLHIKFGGSICRYLRRWLDADDIEPVVAQLKIVTTNSSKGKGKKKEEKKKTDWEIRKEIQKQLEMEEFNYQFRKLLDYHPRNYGFDDFPPLADIGRALNKKSDTDSSTSSDRDTKTKDAEEEDTPKEEGLSLSEYFGFSKKSDNSSTTKTAVETSDSSSNIQKKSRKEEEDLKAKMYAKACESGSVLEPKEEDGDGEEELDKIPISSSDKNYEEVRKMFLLGKPHPNVEFEQLNKKSLSKEDAKKLKKCKEYIKKAQREGLSKEDLLNGETPRSESVPKEKVEKGKKRHACANCRKVEPKPKQFKKCQKCHGKGTRFYCSRDCQEEDWIHRHRDEHTDSIEDVT